VVYHGSTVPGGWFVHDQIGDVRTGDQVSLGSWYDAKPVIAFVGTAVPEPSSVLVACIFGLGAVSRRRRSQA
jgi:hypothetical protein